MGKLTLYINTIRYLKADQIWHQLTKKAGLPCPLVRGYAPVLNMEAIRGLPALWELDHDPDFLGRFSADALMWGNVTFLHESEHLDLEGSWFFQNRSPLWNHNLHYFEYLFSLAERYRASGQLVYFEKIKEYIAAWIKSNPKGSKNSAWECYPIALRLPNWIEIYSLLRGEIDRDKLFKEQFIRSLFEQYAFLLYHLEKHLLANHYFEDLKALVIASVFFEDETVQRKATEELVKQCKEQIQEDGTQYERSPMYQKILLEDLIRVEVALEYICKGNETIRQCISKMLDVAYSLESGLDRMPLFNDCGTNVAKSLDALVKAAENRLGIKPQKKNAFPDGGWYIFSFGNKNEWRLVVDAGQPGPDYAPGHSHCEMMSFELFCGGRPVIVNCGTYAYQCGQRQLFKCTAAHNTVMVSDAEQSECWSSFRMARRARIEDVEIRERGISMRMTDYLGHEIARTIDILLDSVVVTDQAHGEHVESYLHFADDTAARMIDVQKGKAEQSQMPYAEEFGVQREIRSLRICGKETVSYNIRLSDG